MFPSVIGSKEKLSCFPNAEKNSIFDNRIARNNPIKTFTTVDIVAKNIDLAKEEVKSSVFEKSGLKIKVPEIPLTRKGNRYRNVVRSTPITMPLLSNEIFDINCIRLFTYGR